MSEEQELFETMMGKMCASVMRDMQPHVVQAAQARAELRDRFAMAALTGLMGDPDSSMESNDWLAKVAYQYADAMLKARGND